MKKKLLVTTAALSLSVTSLAPVSSFAAIHDNNYSEKEITPIDDWEDRDESARRAAQDLTSDHMSGIIGIINESRGKLGYLKGSKLVVPFHWFKHSFSEDKFPLKDTIKHTNGSVTLQKLYSPDKTIQVTFVREPGSLFGKIIFEKLKNKNVSEIELQIEDKYEMQTWIYQWPGWFQVGDRTGTTATHRYANLNIFEEAPKLNIEADTNVHAVNTNSNVKPEDFFKVNSHAGHVKSEFVRKPDLSELGEQTATIRVWDEYGEEDRNDLSHNTTFDVKFNVKDSTNWETEDLRGWNFNPYEENQIKRVKDSDNSLTGNYAMYSTGAMSAYKEYHLEPGATYKFTTFIKPKHVNQDDLILLTLTGNGEQRVLLGTSPNTLPSVEKGFKKLSHEFTVKDGEENPLLFFDFRTNQKFFIDSFELEQVK